MEEKKYDNNDLTAVDSTGYGEVQIRRLSCTDAVFGEIGVGGPNYRNVSVEWL